MPAGDLAPELRHGGRGVRALRQRRDLPGQPVRHLFAQLHLPGPGLLRRSGRPQCDVLRARRRAGMCLHGLAGGPALLQRNPGWLGVQLHHRRQLPKLRPRLRLRRRRFVRLALPDREQLLRRPLLHPAELLGLLHQRNVPPGDRPRDVRHRRRALRRLQRRRRRVPKRPMRLHGRELSHRLLRRRAGELGGLPRGDQRRVLRHEWGPLRHLRLRPGLPRPGVLHARLRRQGVRPGRLRRQLRLVPGGSGLQRRPVRLRRAELPGRLLRQRAGQPRRLRARDQQRGLRFRRRPVRDLSERHGLQ